MIKVTLIGAGNVAQHLISTFLSTSNIEIVQVFARNSATTIDGMRLTKLQVVTVLYKTQMFT